MKKIYILTAVFALLTLSLNAQSQLKVDENGNVVPPKSSTEQVEQGEKVVTPPDGYFRMGPSRASTDPVTPPYSNDFSSSVWNWWEVIDANSDGSTWTYNDDGYAQYAYNYYGAANDWLVTAPIYLEAGKTYKFYIDAWLRSTRWGNERMEVRLANANTANALSAGTTIIASTDVTSTSSTNFNNENVTVSTTGNYYFGIHCISDANIYYLYVDNLVIDVESEPVHDLKAYVTAPSKMYKGQTATVSAKVTNTGDFDESSYTVTFKANGTVISTQTVNESLAVGASKMFYAEYTTTDEGTVNFTATVACDNDADATNDNATASMSVIAVPAPENVEATDGDQNSTVTWEAPNIAPVTVTEDFENIDVFEPFSVGGISATVHTGKFKESGWTLYETTGAEVWPSGNDDFPNEGAPQAWMPFNATALGSGVKAYSGDQYVESICPKNTTTQANSWLISPELSGNAQTITFWERVLGNYGNESYEVLYSLTDNNPASFTSVKTFADATLTWTQRSADLPAGTKYFAIRHYSTNIFGLLIDDITYEVAGEQPVSYNVYLDGVLQGNVPSTTNPLSYDFSNVAYGEHTCSINAVYDGNIESELVSDTFVSAAKTATPTISYQETPAGVVVTATGEGHVTLVVDGIKYEGDGSVSATVVRSLEDRTVTATATAKAEGKAESDPAEEDILVHKLAGQSTGAAEGLLRLHLLLLDQMLEDIPDDNNHPDRYGYVLRYEPDGPNSPNYKESSTVYVDIQKADCEVHGYYSLKELDNDVNVGRYDAETQKMVHDQGITLNVMTADVEYDLSSNNDLLYEYLLQGKEDEVPEYQQDYLTRLRKTQNFTYVEMMDGPNKGREYNNGEHHFTDELKTGSYSDSFKSYVPSVSTWGIERRYYEDDGLDNTYGAPVWKTGVGKVVVNSATAMQQHNAWNSVNWTYEGENCSLYMLDNIDADGYLPSVNTATVQYEPYMFRVFVESKNGKLRNYTTVDAVPGSDTQGEHLVGVETKEADKHGPKCVWTAYVNTYDDETLEALNTAYGNEFKDPADGEKFDIKFHKDTVDRAGGSSNNGIGNQDWNKDANNAMFGAVNLPTTTTQNGQVVIDKDDLTIFVRFYYIVKGMSAGHKPWLTTRDGDEDSGAGYGVEGESGTTGAATAVSEIHYLGEIESQTYYNVQGMQSDKPFDGINIVVTRYSNGTTSVTKVIK